MPANRLALVLRADHDHRFAAGTSEVCSGSKGGDTVSRTISGDDLAAKLYTRQGFLVFGTYGTFLRGEIIRKAHVDGTDGTRVPLRIIGPSTLAEFLEQGKVASAITGIPDTGRTSCTRFYRVEAAD